MHSFNEWAEHYGYTDSDESRREYQAYCDNLATLQAVSERPMTETNIPVWSAFYVVQDRDLPDGRRLIGDIVDGPFDTRDQAHDALDNGLASGRYVARWMDESDPIGVEERRYFR